MQIHKISCPWKYPVLMRKIGTQNKRMVWMERKVEETSSSMHLTKMEIIGAVDTLRIIVQHELKI